MVLAQWCISRRRGWLDTTASGVYVMPRKAIATAAGLVALFVERGSLEGDAMWAVFGSIALYLICHTATDIASMVWGSKEDEK